MKMHTRFVLASVGGTLTLAWLIGRVARTRRRLASGPTPAVGPPPPLEDVPGGGAPSYNH